MKQERKRSRPLNFALILILLIAGLIRIEMSGGLNAQPHNIHLSLGIKRTSEASVPVSVTWVSEPFQGNQFVKYGPTPETAFISKARKSDFDGDLIFNTRLKKLKRGTRYYYKCGSDATGWSSLYSFSSEPDSSRFRVGIIGDTQNNTNNEDFMVTKSITDLVKIYSPSFTIHMGDIVDNGSVSSNWSGFLTATQELNAVSPLMPVLGNHDVENARGKDFQRPFQTFHSLFDLPGDEVNYAFTYMNTRFIGVFSGCAQAAEETDEVKYKPGSAEYRWLDNELTRAEKDNKIKWIVVWMHYPVLSYGWSNISDWKDNILPLIGRHRVDLCLAGHRHVYERHHQMKNGDPVSKNSVSSFRAGEGTIFITNGTAGGNPTGPGGKDMPTLAFTASRQMYNFSIMDINNRSITYRVFDKDNLLIDWFTITR